MIVRILLLAMLCCCLARPAAAATPLPGNRPVPLSAFQRITYLQDSAVPRAIDDVLQTSDGFVWLVGSNALYRFDGVRAERYEVEGEPFSLVEGQRSLATDDDNGLWFGYIRGGIAHLRRDTLTRYGVESGLPDARQVTSLVARHGRVLAGTQAGLFVLDGARWEPLPGPAQLRDAPIDNLLLDAGGRLWVRSAAQLFHQARPDGPFEQRLLPEDSLVGGLIEHPDGSIWSWSNAGAHNLCRVFPDPVPVCWRGEGLVSPMFDAEGALWWSQPHRTYRIADVASLVPGDGAPLDAHAEMIELPGSYVQATADGSVWVMSDEGITRLRRPLLERTATPSGGIAGGDGGDAWLISYTRGLMRVGDLAGADGPLMVGEDRSLWLDTPAVEGDRAAFQPLQGPAYRDEAVVLERHLEQARSGMRIDRDANGDLLVCRLAPLEVLRYSQGRTTRIEIPALSRGAVLRGAKRDAGGRLWIGVSRHDTPLYQQTGSGWLALGGRPVPDGTRLNGYAFDAQDTLWIAAGIDGVLAVDAGAARRFGPGEGLDIGTAVEIFSAGGRIWASGMQGIAVYDGGRFVTLRGRGGERFAVTSGFVHRDDGELWLNGVDGVSRIPAEEWRTALARPGYEVRYTRLDRWDGINSPAASGPYPAAAESADGTLWFAMRAGLFRLAPDRMPPPQPPPTVELGTLGIDGRTRLASSGVVLPPGPHRIVLGFHAPLAERPERVQFRYRLARNGRVGDWVFLGHDRQVVFEQLGHGDYGVEIAASGRDGDWATAGTTLAFRIQPAPYQTWWFQLLAVAALAAVLGGLYLLRVRQLSARLRDELDARLRERERIARDLHDTLLQGVQGLLLSFQGVASRLAAGDPLRTRMEQALDHAEEIVREGRDRVSQLRDPQADTLDLCDALRRHAQPLAAERQMLCELDVRSTPRPLRPDAYEELLQVGREAIGNAFNHSRGSAVGIVLDYRDDGVLLAVQDDGIGIAERTAPPGHWGLRGMRERASLVAGTLEIGPGPAGGTRILMRVPANRAYPRHASSTPAPDTPP